MHGRERALRYHVAGRVQGVCFRAATGERASGLALRGWARNLQDACVEVVAAGDPEALAELAAWLWDGPPAARVTSVGVEEWNAPVPPGFAIR